LPILARSKRPAIDKWSDHCIDPLPEVEISRLIAQGSFGLGVACGYAGLVAIDIDTEDPAIIAAVRKVLPESAVAKRGKKGRTDFYCDPSAEVVNRKFRGREGRVPIVEILAVGSQTVLPPTIHPDIGEPYVWLGESTLFDTVPEELPRITTENVDQLADVLAPWLHTRTEVAAADDLRPRRNPGQLPEVERKRYEAYARKAVDAQAQELAAAGAGGRNVALFNAACSVGRFAHHGLVTHAEVTAALVAACDRNGLLKEDGRHSILATIRSAIGFSSNDPLPELEDRQRRGSERDRSHEALASQAYESWQSPQEQAPEIAFEPTPHSFPARSSIPTRPFIYGTHYIRKYVGATVAPGGVGKSSLVLVEAASLATGRALIGYKSQQPRRVWHISEDDLDEVSRRIAGICKHYELEKDDFGGRLFVDSFRHIDLVLIEQDRGGIHVLMPRVQALITALKTLGIDVLQIDPFVKSHRLPENDNGAMDRAFAMWAHVAEQANCAIELIIHTRKATPGGTRSIEDARGGYAQIAATRDARLLVRMDAEEATKLGIAEGEIYKYVRIGDTKSNMSPPADKAQWYKLESVSLDNPAQEADADNPWPDNVQVVTLFKAPQLFDGVSMRVLDKAMRAIEAGQWRESYHSPDWVGHAIGAAIDVDSNAPEGRARIRQIINEWLKSGAIERHQRRDGNRKEVTFIRLGNWRFDRVETMELDECE
jgi:hypothetical protein